MAESVRALTPRLPSNVVKRCTVLRGLSSAMISSLLDSIHSPEMEVNPPKTAPCGGIIIYKDIGKNKQTEKGHTRNPLLPMECVCQCTVAYRVTPESSSGELRLQEEVRAHSGHTLLNPFS